jgi:hypothetical protein
MAKQTVWSPASGPARGGGRGPDGAGQIIAHFVDIAGPTRSSVSRDLPAMMIVLGIEIILNFI